MARSKITTSYETAVKVGDTILAGELYLVSKVKSPNEFCILPATPLNRLQIRIIVYALWLRGAWREMWR